MFPALIAHKAPLALLDFSPRDAASVQFIQVPQDGAGFVGIELGREFCQRGVTNRFARDSQEAIDEEAAPAHLVAIAEGIDIAQRSVGRPVLHLPQPPLCCQQ